MDAARNLEDAVRSLGITPAAVRFDRNVDGETAVRYRCIARPGTQTLDGSTPESTCFFEVECRAPEAFGGRRIGDDLIAALGTGVTHVLSRQDWMDSAGGRVSRSLKKQRVTAHTMIVGLEAS